MLMNGELNGVLGMHSLNTKTTWWGYQVNSLYEGIIFTKKS